MAATNKDRECLHSEPPRLPYIAWHIDANQRHKRGEKQFWCPACERWIWAEFWPEGYAGIYAVVGHPDGETIRQCKEAERA